MSKIFLTLGTTLYHTTVQLVEQRWNEVIMMTLKEDLDNLLTLSKHLQYKVRLDLSNNIFVILNHLSAMRFYVTNELYGTW